MAVRTYDYLCPQGHVTDFFDWEQINPATITCTCGSQAQRVWLKSPGMSPDSYWSGKVVKGLGYITSRSQLTEEMRQKGQRFWEPGVSEDAQNTMKEKQRKRIADGKEAIAKSLSGVDLSIYKTKKHRNHSIVNDTPKVAVHEYGTDYKETV